MASTRRSEPYLLLVASAFRVLSHTYGTESLALLFKTRLFVLYGQTAGIQRRPGYAHTK